MHNRLDMLDYAAVPLYICRLVCKYFFDYVQWQSEIAQTATKPKV